MRSRRRNFGSTSSSGSPGPCSPSPSSSSLKGDCRRKQILTILLFCFEMFHIETLCFVIMLYFALTKCFELMIRVLIICCLALYQNGLKMTTGCASSSDPFNIWYDQILCSDEISFVCWWDVVWWVVTRSKVTRYWIVTICSWWRDIILRGVMWWRIEWGVDMCLVTRCLWWRDAWGDEAYVLTRRCDDEIALVTRCLWWRIHFGGEIFGIFYCGEMNVRNYLRWKRNTFLVMMCL